MQNRKLKLLLEIKELYRQILSVSSELWVTNQATASGSWAAIAKDETSLRIQELIKLDTHIINRFVFFTELHHLIEKSKELLDKAGILLEEDLRLMNEEL